MHRVDVGIVGGGQLARMTIESAAHLGLSTAILDPDPACPAAQFANHHIEAAFDDAEGLRRLAEMSRITTFDIEAGDSVALGALEQQGHLILPRPRVLATIQDKLVQREFLQSHGSPVPRFADLPDPSLESMLAFGFPLVQKARRGGYDGRGVAILKEPNRYADRLHAPSMVEEKVAIAGELAVLVARRPSGELSSYPTVSVQPDPATHALDTLTFPAPISPELDRNARALAEQAIAALEGSGIFSVELFVDTDGKLWVNEISPRPHNAGHVTIEAAATSQFEQHLRAILDLPLGDSSCISPAAMANLLGPPELKGKVRIDLSDALEIPGVRIHLYGKQEVRPGRKMGHLTALDADPLNALERVRQARALIRFEVSSEVTA
ncbi:hypothetical protein ABI59_20060 [Acidobacteria bacterium Mor1]|nr:hypothetical protein ABI59_20060 [Acidobacteria bacterium Mor1]